jgi:hypothetical protein
MQVTCPQCRALADRTYDPPLFRRTKCPHCGYELEEINAKEAAKIADILEKEKEREIEEKTKRDVEFLRQKYSEYQEKWLEDNAGICTPLWCRPIPKEKIPPEGYWREPRSLREWLQILGVKDIDAAEKKVRKTGPFNLWKETAWRLWRMGEI